MMEPVMHLFTNFAACSPKGLQFLPAWYKYLDSDMVAGRCTVKFDVSKTADVGSVLLAIVEMLLRLGGIVAVAFILYGGIQYILSQGEPDKTKGARETIINAFVGLIIAIFATAIVSFVGSKLL